MFFNNCLLGYYRNDASLKFYIGFLIFFPYITFQAVKTPQDKMKKAGFAAE